MSQPATCFAVLTAMAKQIPCAGRITAVLTPMTSPRELTSGPPELPGFNAASVWMILSINRPDCARNGRRSALTTPRRDGALKAIRVADGDGELADAERG